MKDVVNRLSIPPAEHYDLPEGHWWICEFPERPPQERLTHYKRRCRKCLVAFIATVRADIDHLFHYADGTNVRHYGDDEALAEWWMIDNEEAMAEFLANYRSRRPTE